MDQEIIQRHQLFESSIKNLMEKRRFDDAKLKIFIYIDQLKLIRPVPIPNSNLAKAYNLMGLVEYMKVEFGAAKQHYTAALEKDHSLAAAYFNRGTVCYRMGEVEAALTDMEAAVILDPNNAEFTLGLESTRQLQRQLR